MLVGSPLGEAGVTGTTPGAFIRLSRLRRYEARLQMIAFVNED